MIEIKTNINGAQVKKVKKRIARKKPEPGTREALLEAVKLQKKYNLDFSYINE